jgi:mono/diheme cytochrome c family protein
MSALRVVLPLAMAGLAVTTFAGVDAAKGKQLHDQKCISCHVERYGGDGSRIYLRTDRLIHDRVALDQRVALCNTQTNAGLFPDDEANVAEYLAKRYYKFNAPAEKGGK